MISLKYMKFSKPYFIVEYMLIYNLQIGQYAPHMELKTERGTCSKPRERLILPVDLNRNRI